MDSGVGLWENEFRAFHVKQALSGGFGLNLRSIDGIQAS